MNRLKIFGASILAVALLLLPLGVNAQPPNVSASTTITFTVGESITITATPASVTLLPVAGQYSGASTPITVATTWNLSGEETQLNTCSNLTLGTLPGALSNYQAAIDGGANASFLNSASPFCSGSLGMTGPDVHDQSLTGAQSGSHSDTVVVSTVGLGTVPVGTYSGSVTFTLSVN